MSRPKTRILNLLINDTGDLHILEDTYGVRFYVSLIRTFHDLIEKMMLDYDQIVIRFPLQFVAKSYQRIPTLFLNQLKEKVTEYQVTLQKTGDWLTLRAGYILRPNKFARRVWDTLQVDNEITLRIKDIPKSYRDQPFVLLNRFRKRGLPLRLIRLGGRWKFAKMQTSNKKTKNKTKKQNATAK